MRLIVMVGPPGSGKSTYAATQALPVVTADAIRTEGADAVHVMAMVRREVLRRLRDGESVIVDACNLRPEDRAPWLRLALLFGARPEAWVMQTPPQECARRNAARECPASNLGASLARQRHLGLGGEGWAQIRRIP